MLIHRRKAVEHREAHDEHSGREERRAVPDIVKSDELATESETKKPIPSELSEVVR